MNKRPFYRRWWFILGLLIIVIAIVASNQKPKSTESTSFNPNAVSDLNSSAKQLTDKDVQPQKPYTSFKDGQWEVNNDIKPGKYKTSGAAGCYYARLSSFDVNDIIENNNVNGPATIEILPTDKVFQSKNCGTWTLEQ